MSKCQEVQDSYRDVRIEAPNEQGKMLTPRYYCAKPLLISQSDATSRPKQFPTAQLGLTEPP